MTYVIVLCQYFASIDIVSGLYIIQENITMAPSTLKKYEGVHDSELIVRFQNGEENTICELFARYKETLFYKIHQYFRVEHDKEDVFQDLIEKVMLLLRRGKYSENDLFGAWLIRVCSNMCIDRKRKRTNLSTVSVDEHPTLLEDPLFLEKHIEETIIDKERHAELWQKIATLPKQQREYVAMRYVEGMSYKQISEIANIPINTALGRGFYTRQNLKVLYKIAS
jgi:RNA polymerase sigma-70 factor (ECF subfamily)